MSGSASQFQMSDFLKYKHLGTLEIFHNDVKWSRDHECLVFDMKLDRSARPKQSTRKVLAPIIINPDQIRGKSLVFQGVDSLNQRCALVVIASSAVVKEEINNSSLSGSLEGRASFVRELRETVAKNAKKGKSRRENFLKVGLCDSSQESAGKLAIHCIHKENTCNSNLKSLQFSNPFKTKISQSCFGGLQELAGCLDKIMEKSISSLHGMKRMMKAWKSNQRKCLMTQKKFTGQRTVLKHSVHETMNVADLESEDVTPTHRDNKNAPVELGGPPDFHMNLSNNPSIGLLIYLPIGEECLRPVIVQQMHLATTYFYAASLYHGSVHIGTYVKEYCRMAGCRLEELLGQVDPVWWKRLSCKGRRMFVTCYTRSTIPLIHHTVKGYKALKRSPLMKKPIRGKGRGQLKSDRIQRALRTKKREVQDKTAEFLFSLGKQLNDRMVTKQWPKLV